MKSPISVFSSRPPRTGQGDPQTMDLILIGILTATLAPIIALASPPAAVSAGLGLPLLLFMPGYAVVAALFPGNRSLEPVERIVLSLALSLAIVVLVGLALNYTPGGVRRESVVASLALLTMAAAAAGLLHRRWLPPELRFRIDLLPAAPRRINPALLAGLGTAAALAAAAPAALALIGIPHLAPQGIHEEFSEFYLLGAGGGPPELPSALPLGETASVRLAIVNREESAAAYSVSLLVNHQPAPELPAVPLRPGERWEGAASFTLSTAGPRQLVEFVLRRDGRSSPYRTLQFWVDAVPVPPPPVNALAAAAPAATPPPPPAPRLHVVTPGDNMTVIARLYGLALSALLAVNDLADPNLIHPGEQITIPVAAAPGQ